jgi:malate dehydrogenase
MSRRDLAVQNGRIVKFVSEATAPRNPGAKYIVISNPVDAMAMLCKKFSKAEFVIGTGTNLESLRFRSKLASILKVSNSKVQGWVGGEHGDAAIPLWSTTRICGRRVDNYVSSEELVFNKSEIESYVKSVSKHIVDNIGGTEYGPAASFRDITRAIVMDTREILSIATPIELVTNQEPIFIGIPVHVGREIGCSLFEELLEQEQVEIAEAARVVHQTYKMAMASIE